MPCLFPTLEHRDSQAGNTWNNIFCSFHSVSTSIVMIVSSLQIKKNGILQKFSIILALWIHESCFIIFFFYRKIKIRKGFFPLKKYVLSLYKKRILFVVIQLIMSNFISDNYQFFSSLKEKRCLVNSLSRKRHINH